jgi:hypothetical protein
VTSLAIRGWLRPVLIVAAFTVAYCRKRNYRTTLTRIMNMKHVIIITSLLALSGCASFTAGAKVAPGFPDDPFELSKRTDSPQPRVALAAVGDSARL